MAGSFADPAIDEIVSPSELEGCRDETARFSQGDPDRMLELEEYLEPSLDTIITVAAIAGYTEAEALTALASLIDHRHLANAENFVTDAMIRKAGNRGKPD